MTSASSSIRNAVVVARRRRLRNRQASEPRRLGPLSANLLRLALVVAVVLLWQFVPLNLGLRKVFPALDPFFISSPAAIAKTLGNLMTGSNGAPLIWPYVAFTLRATFVGAALGILLGGIMGLVLSNDPRLRQVLAPFINAANSMPKIALIPVIVIILGPSAESSVAVSVMIVDRKSVV